MSKFRVQEVFFVNDLQPWELRLKSSEDMILQLVNLGS